MTILEVMFKSTDQEAREIIGREISEEIEKENNTDSSDVGKCKECKHYQGLVTVPNGHKDVLKNKINCFMFGYIEVFIDANTCKSYKER